MMVLSRVVACPLFFICLGAAQIFSASFSLATEKIDINTTSKEELRKITGVGPVIAQRIIDARPFVSVHDLIRVSGIGEITLQKIIVQGLVWVSLEFNSNPANITSPPAIQKETDRDDQDEESQGNQSQKRRLAAIGEQNPKAFNSPLVFLTALGLAIFSGATIMFLEKRLI